MEEYITEWNGLTIVVAYVYNEGCPGDRDTPPESPNVNILGVSLEGYNAFFLNVIEEEILNLKED